eukprot:552381-Prymnesium_polylepis.3
MLDRRVECVLRYVPHRLGDKLRSAKLPILVGTLATLLRRLLMTTASSIAASGAATAEGTPDNRRAGVAVPLRGGRRRYRASPPRLTRVGTDRAPPDRQPRLAPTSIARIAHRSKGGN